MEASFHTGVTRRTNCRVSSASASNIAQEYHNARNVNAVETTTACRQVLDPTLFSLCHPYVTASRPFSCASTSLRQTTGFCTTAGNAGGSVARLSSEVGTGR